MKVCELKFDKHYTDVLKNANKDVCPLCGGKLSVFCVNHFAFGSDYCVPIFAIICDNCLAAADIHWSDAGYDYHNDKRCLDAVSDLKENILEFTF